jgi:hypothetical protein
MPEGGRACIPHMVDAPVIEKRNLAITWVYPALGCVSIVLVITIGVLILRMGSSVKQAYCRPAVIKTDPCASFTPEN